MLGKPRISFFPPARLINSIKHEHSCKILYVNSCNVSYVKVAIYSQCHYKVRMSAKIRNRYNQAPHLTQDTNGKWESDNFTIRHHKREPRGQPFPSRSPQGIDNRHA